MAAPGLGRPASHQTRRKGLLARFPSASATLGNLGRWTPKARSWMLETKLDMAKRHVREAEEHVARQRRLVADLRRDEHYDMAEKAEALLQTFEDLLAGHRAGLAVEAEMTRRRGHAMGKE